MPASAATLMALARQSYLPSQQSWKQHSVQPAKCHVCQWPAYKVASEPASSVIREADDPGAPAPLLRKSKICVLSCLACLACQKQQRWMRLKCGSWPNRGSIYMHDI